jgi:hypothetical protein
MGAGRRFARQAADLRSFETWRECLVGAGSVGTNLERKLTFLRLASRS